MNFSAQLRELAIAYFLTAVAMLIGLLLMRADRRAYFRWPVYSAMAMTLGVVSWNLMRKHLLPVEWGVTQTNALYFGALSTYASVGFGLGLLLGRLTGRKTAAESESSTE
jgi:hypothetical protein